MTLLTEVEATLHDAVRRHQQEQANAARPMQRGGVVATLRTMRRSRLRLVGAGVFTAAVVTVVTVLVTDAGRSSAPPPPSRNAQVLPAALRADFVSLRTVRSMSDTLPNDVVTVLMHERIGGIDVSQSRLLLESKGTAVWLVPGPQRTCLALRRVLSGPIARTAIPIACSPNSVVEQSGIVSISAGIIAAVLPDGSGPHDCHAAGRLKRADATE